MLEILRTQDKCMERQVSEVILKICWGSYMSQSWTMHEMQLDYFLIENVQKIVCA